MFEFFCLKCCLVIFFHPNTVFIIKARIYKMRGTSLVKAFRFLYIHLNFESVKFSILLGYFVRGSEHFYSHVFITRNYVQKHFLQSFRYSQILWAPLSLQSRTSDISTHFTNQYFIFKINLWYWNPFGHYFLTKEKKILF